MTIKTALEHHLAGRLSQAESLYQGLLQKEPDNPDALYFLGVLARQQGRQAEALEFILRAIAAGPSSPAYNTLGNIYKDMGRLDEAALRDRQALEITPDSAEALFNLGNILQQQHRLEEAVSCYHRLLAIRPDSAEAHNDLGVALMAQGRWDEAVESFNQALACRPEYAETWNNSGVACKNQGKMEEALACYHRALAIRPEYAQALFNIGTVYFVKKDFPQAMTWYQASLAVNPAQVEAHQNMALILFDTGRLDEAQYHRDQAYGRQSVFIDTAPRPVRTVLVLWAAGRGNVPIEFLLPATTTTRITWMMEYATEGQEQALPDYDLVFNAIGDEDAAGPTTESVTRFLSHCTRPVLNLPAAIAKTARHLIPSLLAPVADAVVPETVCIKIQDFKEQVLTRPGIRLPVIVRPSGSHGGAHMVKLESAEELLAITTLPSEVYYATNYHDYRSPDGWYRKYRMVFVDRIPYPYHLAIGGHWMIHYETAGMLTEAWKRDEELRFLKDPGGVLGAKAMAAVEAIGILMDLEYCGLDFSLLPDGRILVFEANSTMLIHPEDEQGILGFKNPFVARIFEAFNALLTRLAAANPR